MDRDELNQLIPVEAESTEAATGGFFSLIQASFFDCGGVAIGVSISHKLADATTEITFMRCWAAATTVGPVVVPSYDSEALFPPRVFTSAPVPQVADLEEVKEKFHAKRLAFDAANIAALQAAATSVSVERPSRAEAVTALIWKCALQAARSNSGFSKSSTLLRAVNLRQRLSPPLTSNSVGNLAWFYLAQKDKSRIELQGLVRELREKIQVFDQTFQKMLQKEDGFEAATEQFKETASLMMNPDVEFYMCTTLCNMSVYDTNFGWGRPVWATILSHNRKNFIALMDTRSGDGSMEAWVVLSKNDMYLFERDPELFAYASLNPSVLDTHT